MTPSCEPPQRRATSHVTEGFDSGSPALDDWLRRRALRNESEGASRTYAVYQGAQVVA